MYSPNTQLLNVNLDGFIFYFPLISYRLHTIAETYALPVNGNTSKIARFKLSSKFKLFGFITISKDYYDNTAYAPGSQLAIDGVPGAVTVFSSTTLPSINVLFALPGLFGFIGYVSVHTSGTPGNFTFSEDTGKVAETKIRNTHFKKNRFTFNIPFKPAA